MAELKKTHRVLSINPLIDEALKKTGVNVSALFEEWASEYLAKHKGRIEAQKKREPKSLKLPSDFLEQFKEEIKAGQRYIDEKKTISAYSRVFNYLSGRWAISKDDLAKELRTRTAC